MLHIDTVETLERQMLLINDLSGAVVTGAQVVPGKAVGTSDFGVTATSTEKSSGYLVLDNNGSRYTGEYRLSGGININSLSGVGDQLTFTGLRSNTGGVQNVGFNYQRPVGYEGWKGGVSYGYTDYELSKIPNYVGTGDTGALTLSASYPLLKTRSRVDELRFRAVRKEISDKSGLPGGAVQSEKRVQSLTAELYDKRATHWGSGKGRLNSTVAVTLGDTSMGNTVATDNDATLQSDGRYHHINLDLQHSQELQTGWKLNSHLRAQFSAGRNLDSSADISLGGSQGVRAYEDSELSGDSGYSLSFDFVNNLPQIEEIGVDQEWYLFVDTARAKFNNRTFNSESNYRSLHAAGIGYTAKRGNTSFKASFGRGFGADSDPQSESEFSTSRNKLLLQLVHLF